MSAKRTVAAKKYYNFACPTLCQAQRQSANAAAAAATAVAQTVRHINFLGHHSPVCAVCR